MWDLIQHIIRAFKIGPTLSKALVRHEEAAAGLDAAVKEMLRR